MGLWVEGLGIFPPCAGFGAFMLQSMGPGFACRISTRVLQADSLEKCYCSSWDPKWQKSEA